MSAANAVEARNRPSERLAGQAEAVAAASRDMAERFASGGRLYAFGTGLAAADAQHVSVEFVHPVIVGKRALPATALAGGSFDHQLRVLARPGDIALGFSPIPDDEVRSGLEAAASLGLLTIELTGGGAAPPAGHRADHQLEAPSDDPLVVRELHVTTYHILWELVHIFLEAAP
jgi:D-sedoheptulose 7-phosphate isomerase